jgi:hypothetical protein
MSMSEEANTDGPSPDVRPERPRDPLAKESSAKGGGIQFSSAVSPAQRELLERVALALAGGAGSVHEKS